MPRVEDIQSNKAKHVVIGDAGAYFASLNVEDALQELIATLIPNTYLKLDCSNDPLTAPLDLPELYNSLGSLKIMPDVQGNVDLFGDTDVADGDNGKIFTVNRRAAEGDTTLSIYGRADRYAVIDANWDIEINSNVAAGRIKLGAVATNIVNLLGSTENSVGWGNGTGNLLWRHYGYITAGGLSGQRYIQYQVDDTDDYYWLTGQASILGFKIDMPVDLIDNSFITTGTLGAGAITGTSFIVGAYTLNTEFQFLDGIASYVYRSGGTDVAVADGGLDLSSIAAGSMLVANSANTYVAISSTSGIKVPVNNAGTTAFQTVTGTGAPVLATSPTIITPSITTKATITGTAPTVAVGSGAGSGGTVSISGSNSAFVITLTTGTTAVAADDLFTVTYGNAFTVNSVPIKDALNADAAALSGATQVRAVGSATTCIFYSGPTKLADSTEYIWNVWVGGY